MTKTIFSTLFFLLTLSTSYAAEEAAQAQAPAIEAPANPESVTSNQLENPAPSNNNQENIPRESNIQTNNDKLLDYRYCLDLKTNQEISHCRYKK